MLHLFLYALNALLLLLCTLFLLILLNILLQLVRFLCHRFFLEPLLMMGARI